MTQTEKEMLWLTNLIFYLSAILFSFLLLLGVFQRPSFVASAIIPAIVVFRIYSDSKKGKYPFSLLGLFHGLIACLLIYLGASDMDFPSLGSFVMILVGLPSLYAFYHLSIRKKTKLEWLENWEQKLKREFNSREMLKEHNGYKIYHSKNFYWFENESFTSIKDVEGHINNNIDNK